MNTPQRADPQCTQKQAFDQRWSQKSVLLLDAEDETLSVISFGNHPASWL